MASKPLPANAKRDAILAKLLVSAELQPVAEQVSTEGSKYIAAFRSSKGIIFALDKMSASKQPIWCLDRRDLRTALEGLGLEVEFYPADRGRNSNLHKLPGFKTSALLRAYPETVDEALQAAAIITDSKSI